MIPAGIVLAVAIVGAAITIFIIQRKAEKEAAKREFVNNDWFFEDEA